MLKVDIKRNLSSKARGFLLLPAPVMKVAGVFFNSKSIKMSHLATATVFHQRDGRVSLNFFDDSSRRVDFYHLKVWDMSQVQVPRNFKLTTIQERQFKDILFSKKGKKILNELKNKKTEKIINAYIESEQVLIKSDPIKERSGHSQPLKDFLESVKATPLVGKNCLRRVVVGVSRKEMWEEFIRQGLVPNKTENHDARQTDKIT